MTIDLTRHARLTMMGAAVCGALAAGACKGKPNGTDTSGMNAATSDTTGSGTTGMAPAATDTGGAAANATGSSGTLTDANIVALLDEANKADSSAGAYALTRAHNAGVKSFAKMMMGEHHALRVQGQALAKKLNITPQPPANDPVQALATTEMDTLRAAGRAATFDRSYIDQEVGVHKAVLDLADKAHDQTQNAELKALIEKAKPTIQKHLDRAEALQKTLSKSTT
jgi:putative membrane protein